MPPAQLKIVKNLLNFARGSTISVLDNLAVARPPYRLLPFRGQRVPTAGRTRDRDPRPSRASDPIALAFVHVRSHPRNKKYRCARTGISVHTRARSACVYVRRRSCAVRLATAARSARSSCHRRAANAIADAAGAALASAREPAPPCPRVCPLCARPLCFSSARGNMRDRGRT